MVELKDIRNNSLVDEKEKRKNFRETIIQKFINSAKILESQILNFLGINTNNIKIIALLIVPKEILAIIKRLNFLDIQKKKRNEINEWKVNSCEKDLWSGQ